MHPIIVVGAGPGGLTAALALARRGISAVVLERSPEPRAVGAGITVQVNAMRALASLGVADAVAAAGTPLASGAIETAEGVVIQDLALGELHQRFGQPGVALHRAALGEVLSRALPEGAVRYGAAVTGVVVDDEGITVHLEEGGAVRGRALIGADGIHSAVRSSIFGPVAPVYAGYTCWRGVAPRPTGLPEGRSVERWGRGRRFGIVPVGSYGTYWFATENGPPGGTDGPDVKAELITRFAEFGPAAAGLLEATDAFLRNDILGLPLLATWVRGRVALLGDAAHAMTPNLGQGACQAIEDAVVIAECLGAEPDPAVAMRAYEARRFERARAIVRRSEQLGRVAQWENGAARGVRDALLRRVPAALVERQLQDLYGVELPPAP